MRISDWSPDVCSSDLQPSVQSRRSSHDARRISDQPYLYRRAWRATAPAAIDRSAVEWLLAESKLPQLCRLCAIERFPHGRSEEHRSELQSLMRTSYAVFCLKNTTTTPTITFHTLTHRTADPSL